MNLLRFYQTALVLAWTGITLVAIPKGVAQAESFSLKLNGLGRLDASNNSDQSISGTMTLNSEGQESQEIGFNLRHGDQGDQQTLELAIRDKNAPLLEAIFDLFGLGRPRNSRSSEFLNPLEAEVSGDINPDKSELEIKLGDQSVANPPPRMRVQIRTPRSEQ